MQSPDHPVSSGAETRSPSRAGLLWLTAAVSAVRAAFGLIWAIDAYLT
jgi:hypothetical protein